MTRILKILFFAFFLMFFGVTGAGAKTADDGCYCKFKKELVDYKQGIVNVVLEKPHKVTSDSAGCEESMESKNFLEELGEEMVDYEYTGCAWEEFLPNLCCQCERTYYTLEEISEAWKTNTQLNYDSNREREVAATAVENETECQGLNTTQPFPKDPSLMTVSDKSQRWDQCKTVSVAVDKCDALSGTKLSGTGPAGMNSGVSVVLDIGVDASVLNKLSSTDVKTVIGTAIKTVMGLMGSVALAMFVYGGVLWMASAGNAERSKKGMQVIVWAALGMFMILASYAIVNFIFSTFK